MTSNINSLTDPKITGDSFDSNERFEGYIKNKKNRQEQRYPVEDPEGISVPPTYERKEPLADYPGAVSLTEIEVLDLLSEGEIDGLVDGKYTFNGTLGTVGYDSVDYTAYENAPGTSVNWLRSVYWNEVPVVNNDNKFNFQSVQVKSTNGLPNGSLAGLISNELTASRSIGERLRYGEEFSKKYRFLNKDIKAIEVSIKVNQLSQSNTTKEEWGDVESTRVDYTIYWKPIYSSEGKTPTSYSIVNESIIGKISQGYIRQTRINFWTNEESYYSESDFLGWEIKVTRTTPDAITTEIRNQTYIDSVTEVYGDIFTYPNSAIVSSRFSAEYFSQVPARAFDTKLLKVKVFDNYNPLLKQYTGDWGGTFREDKEWSDNPALVFYDLLTNNRYGLGNYIDSDKIDKWTLYEIARYCDTMVPDGFGGVEPRFTCNLIIASREEAYKVMSDMASIFRAMTYYFAGSIYAVQDSYKSSNFFQFTNANVEDGDFQYSSSSRRARHTVAIVRYNDKTDFYKPAVEYVEDIDGIKKYGVRELDITAFGCTSRGQALRLGKWALISETLETETVSFMAGLEGAYLRPGDIVQICDQNRKAQRLGGRTSRLYNESRILLDSEVTGLTTDSLYYFSLLTPTYTYEPSLVTFDNSADSTEVRKSHLQRLTFLGSAASGITGDDNVVRTEITFPSSFDSTNFYFSGNPVWLIEGSGVNDKYFNQWEYFRVINIDEKDDNKFEISALQYATGKFALVESGVNFEQPAYADPPAGPTSLKLLVWIVDEYEKSIYFQFTVPDKTNVAGYQVFVKNAPFISSDVNGNNYLFTTLPIDKQDGYYYPPEDGRYYFRVYSINKLGTKSSTFADADIEIKGINKLANLIIGGLVLDEQETDNTDGGSKTTATAIMPDPNFKWQVGLETERQFPTGIYYRVTAREPSDNNIPSTHIYYEKTGILKDQVSNLKFQFNFYDNFHSESNQGYFGPFREYDLVVEAMTTNGDSSAGGNFLSSPNYDSSYSDSNGYDILAVNNPRITDFKLTTDTVKSDTYTTDQWISPDGNIYLKITEGGFPEDLDGAYIYYSTEIFNRAEAIGITTTDKTIDRYTILESGNLFLVPANLTGVNTAYMSVSLYDLFDGALIATGENVEHLLEMSNVAKIKKRGAFEKDDNLYRAWAQITYSNGAIDSDWVRYSANIKSITSQEPAGVTFYFKESLLTTYYSVGYTPALITTENMYGYVNSAPRVYKYLDRFTVLNVPNGTFIFSVLYKDEQ